MMPRFLVLAAEREKIAKSAISRLFIGYITARDTARNLASQIAGAVERCFSTEQAQRS
jgi:hypothetical protein